MVFFLLKTSYREKVMDFRIGHVAYQTKDMKATLSFYTDILNFRHAFSIKDKDDQPWIEYIMTPDGRFIELFYPKSEETPELGRSYLHLCLEVDDCAAAVTELEGKGVEIWKPLRQGRDGNYQAWIKDPDGRQIEIMQLAENSEQCKNRNSL